MHVERLLASLGLLVQADAELQSTLQKQSSEIASLREQCSNHAKERAALKTILDAKIKALVDDIGQSVSDLPAEVRFRVCCSIADICHMPSCLDILLPDCVCF